MVVGFDDTRIEWNLAANASSLTQWRPSQTQKYTFFHVWVGPLENGPSFSPPLILRGGAVPVDLTLELLMRAAEREVAQEDVG